MYLNTHFVVTTCTLAFIYLFRNEHFYFVRNMFMVAMGLALVGYVVYPDRAAADAARARASPTRCRTSPASRDATVNALYNPYAAVPSMHVGFALMLAVPMIRIDAPPLGQGAVGGLRADRHRRRRRDRQPLGLRRRRPARPWRLSPRVAAQTAARARAAADVGVGSPKAALPAPARAG